MNHMDTNSNRETPESGHLCQSSQNSTQVLRANSCQFDDLEYNHPFATGRSSAWQSAWFGTKRSQVRILSPRFGIARHELPFGSSLCPKHPHRFETSAGLGSLSRRRLLKRLRFGCTECFYGWRGRKNCPWIQLRMTPGWCGCGRHGMRSMAHGMKRLGSPKRIFPAKNDV